MALHELIYVSLATRNMSVRDLSDLLEQSRQKNARLNITGLLVYHNKEFMQLLEGERADIFSLYDTICKDERNTHNYLIWDGPIQQRSFADWSMAFLAPGDLSLEGKPAYSDFLQNGLRPQLTSGPQSMGRSFLISLRDEFLNN